MLGIDLSTTTGGAWVAALQGFVRHLDAARPAVGGRSIASVSGRRFRPLRLQLLLAVGNAGPLKHLGGLFGRGRTQQLAQLGQGRLLLFE
jgi:hypothetical protein